MINRLSKIYGRIVLDHPILVLIMLALLLSFFSYHAKDFKLDSSADSLILEDDKDLRIYREITDRYNVKEFLVVTFAPYQDLFLERSLERLKELREELTQLDRVESVVTLLDIPLLKTSDIKLSEIADENVKTLEDPDVDIRRAKKEILESPIYENFFLSADGQTTALLINLRRDTYFSELSRKRNQLSDKKKSATLSQSEQFQLARYVAEYEDYYADLKDKRHKDIEKIRSIIRPYKKHGVLHLAGVPMIADDMITFIKNDLVTFGLGVLIFIIATLTIIFRQIRWVILPLLSCFFAVLIMIGVLGFQDCKVTVISSNFISLMLILTLSMNIHLAVRYMQVSRDNTSERQADIVSTMVAKMVWPCLYTVLTTILAFSTLVFSGIKPVIDFGWMMTMGLFIAFCTSFLLFPAILVLLRTSSSLITKERQPVITWKLASIVAFHGGKVIVLSILLALISVIGITKLKVENSFINYFSKKTEIYQGMKLVDERLGGTNPLNVILKFDVQEPNNVADGAAIETAGGNFFEEDDFSWVKDYDPRDYWFTPLKIKRIKEVHDYLDNLPEIGKVLSFASVIRVAEELNEGKEFDGLELALLYRKFPDQLKSDMMNPFVSVDNNEARISLRVLDSLEDIRRKDLIEKIRSDLTSKLGFSEMRATVAGVLVLYNNMLQSLFRSQIVTFGTVMLGIGVMFLILFRSLALCIIGIIPNLLAVGVVLGTMGLMDIPLDMMTITIAAIAMGIGVDNSIHYIYRFREEFACNSNYAETLRLCHGNVGKAILTTSTTIMFGFSILVLSNFIPTVYFGIFTGLAMFIALLGALTLLPKLILLWRPFKSSSL